MNCFVAEVSGQTRCSTEGNRCSDSDVLNSRVQYSALENGHNKSNKPLLAQRPRQATSGGKYRQSTEGQRDKGNVGRWMALQKSMPKTSQQLGGINKPGGLGSGWTRGTGWPRGTGWRTQDCSAKYLRMTGLLTSSWTPNPDQKKGEPALISWISPSGTLGTLTYRRRTRHWRAHALRRSGGGNYVPSTTLMLNLARFSYRALG